MFPSFRRCFVLRSPVTCLRSFLCPVILLFIFLRKKRRSSKSRSTRTRRFAFSFLLLRLLIDAKRILRCLIACTAIETRAVSFSVPLLKKCMHLQCYDKVRCLALNVAIQIVDNIFLFIYSKSLKSQRRRDETRGEQLFSARRHGGVIIYSKVVAVKNRRARLESERANRMSRARV